MTASTLLHESPEAEYRHRLDLHRRLSSELEARSVRFSTARLVVFLVLVVVAWLAWVSQVISGLWLVPLLGGFLALVLVHDRVIRRQKQEARRAAFYEAGLARLEERWAGTGVSGEGYRDPAHPYAEDLDVFGPGSLFERLCIVRTAAGESTLAGWLLRPAAADEVLARQQAVAELRPRLALREELALLGEEVRAGLHPGPITAWGEAPPWRPPRWLRPLAVTLSVASVVTLVGWFAPGWGPTPFVLVVMAILLLQRWVQGPVEAVVARVERPAQELSLLAQLLACIEAQPAGCPRLQRVRAELDTAGLPPSAQIARLAGLVEKLDNRRNQLFAPIDILLFWTLHVACAIERWRAACGPAFARWLRASGEFEALCALAGYAYEQPEAPFPELLPAHPPRFEAEALAHPLLPLAKAVGNDVSLGGETTVWIVSGSNMSGKSTLLRAVGVNTVLALAGAPVRARRLRLSPLTVGASIQVRDSLQQGKSRFYAEITRIKAVLELGQPEPSATGEARPPLLFLLDEILHGTNSHDRRIGAEAIVRGLVATGAVGMVTTHDLALTRLAEPLAPRVANVHFQDTLEHGLMHFDFHLRPGVVEKSNALELMRAVGLMV